jgi:2-polyprenyl-6-methoxyphenol hydroxylase-like FAD-dependent oxidoreductase
MPSTSTLSNNGNTNFFLGYAGILLCYPCAQGHMFSIVAPCHRPFNKESHDTAGMEVDPSELIEAYKDFYSPVPELLRQIKKCIRWTIVYLPELQTYSSENGRLVLVGDAAHAMLPAAASASNAAIEDAGTLAECVSACKTKDELRAAIDAYESIRRPRNNRIWEISIVSQRNVSSYTATEVSYEDAMAIRNERLKKATEELAEHLKLSSEERKILQASQAGDEHAVYPSPALLKWLYGYNALATVSVTLPSLIIVRLTR